MVTERSVGSDKTTLSDIDLFKSVINEGLVTAILDRPNRSR